MPARPGVLQNEVIASRLPHREWVGSRFGSRP